MSAVMAYEESLSTSCTTFMCTPDAISALPVLCLRVCRVVSASSARSAILTNARSGFLGSVWSADLGGKHQIIVIGPWLPDWRGQPLSRLRCAVPTQHLGNRRRE